MHVHRRDLRAGVGSRVAARLEAIDSAANAYLSSRHPEAGRGAFGGGQWHAVTRAAFFLAASAGIDVWHCPTRPLGSKYFVRRPPWRGVLGEEFVRLVRAFNRVWVEEAVRGLVGASDEHLARLERADLLPLLTSDDPDRRTLGVRLLGRVQPMWMAPNAAEEASTCE